MRVCDATKAQSSRLKARESTNVLLRFKGEHFVLLRLKDERLRRYLGSKLKERFYI
jgi:hypothetical protein